MGSDITALIRSFRSTGNPLLLLRALHASFRQGRIPEIFRSLIAGLVTRPSQVAGCLPSTLGRLFRKVDPFIGFTFDRNGLSERFGKQFSALPDDFQGTRWSCICPLDGACVVGEYFEGKRVFMVGEGFCHEFRHYCRQPDVRHIHSVASRGSHLLVSTGDARKALDIWQLRDGGLVFTKRLRKHSAGFTAAAGTGRQLYFGTDFSSRPNWIETMNRRRFPFPRDSYLCYVEAMQLIEDRFIVCVSRSKLERGWKTWSVFDTELGGFIYCAGFPGEAGVPLKA